MASFVVETFVAQGDRDRFALDVRHLQAAAEAIVVDGPVNHVRSYLVPSDEMGFHLVDASSAEDVARVATQANIDVERIVRAVGAGPDSAPQHGREAEPREQ